MAFENPPVSLDDKHRANYGGYAPNEMGYALPDVAQPSYMMGVADWGARYDCRELRYMSYTTGTLAPLQVMMCSKRTADLP
jgi:hypothetical protein